jgi:hypothetical protein
MRGAAADELEQYVDAPDVPEWLGDIEASYLPGRKLTSRAKRAGQATYELGVAIGLIEERISELEEGKVAEVAPTGPLADLAKRVAEEEVGGVEEGFVAFHATEEELGAVILRLFKEDVTPVRIDDDRGGSNGYLITVPAKFLGTDGGEGESAEELKEEAEALRDTLQEALDAVDGVEFPGMYG